MAQPTCSCGGKVTAIAAESTIPGPPSRGNQHALGKDVISGAPLLHPLGLYSSCLPWSIAWFPLTEADSQRGSAVCGELSWVQTSVETVTLCPSEGRCPLSLLHLVVI
jgi:hypothetical protein